MNVPRGFVWTCPAEIDRVHDGDTLIAHVLFHPNEGGEAHDVNVRVEGVNSPELNTAEGQAAKRYVEEMLPPGTDVTLVMHKREKYGRLLARVVLPDGQDLSTLLLATGHAKAYLS